MDSNNSRKKSRLYLGINKSYLFFITWPSDFTQWASHLFPGRFLFSALICEVLICGEISEHNISYECKTADVSEGYCYLSFSYSLFNLYFVKIAALKMVM